MPNKQTVASPSWTGKISHTAQLGGIETSILDNGAGRGTRIAWVNTGTGLRYKIILDRAMDIADAFFNHHSLSWLSATGVTYPQPFSNRGVQWLRTFGGGLLTTCGLSHVGGPESDEFGERGLHGHISNTSAEIESIVQPDPFTGNLSFSITGKMREVSALGTNLVLRRIISGVLGEASITIYDEVTNCGNFAAPHMLLYHFNFGWPLADEGSDLLWKGNYQLINQDRDEKIFNKDHNFRKCSAPMELHRGGGEAAAYFDITPDKNGDCVASICNQNISLGVTLTFKKHELPWLTNWQHWGPGEYVTGIEPGTHPPLGQSEMRKSRELIFLGPGETKNYEVKVEVLNSREKIGQLLK